MSEKSLPQLMLTVAPASEPLTLAETKNYLHVETTTNDAFITRLIAVAREYAELYLRRSLITQTWKMFFDGYAPSEVELLLGPVQSVSNVKMIARDSTETIMDSDSYYLSSNNCRLLFDATPISHRVEILYVTGYGNASAVPQPIKQGMLTHIQAMYDSREGNTPLPSSVRTLYSPYKVISL